ncbi:MAG TPA: PAS domain S-box protein, partial [Desulfuromonadales bacterium]|nr:PAS domain S-box protein [Desulfuromonadales bacterium]
MPVMNAMPIRLLLVEDSRTHTELICDALAPLPARIDLTVSSTLAEARGQLASSIPDLAIIDFLLPDGHGTELLERNADTQFPVIVLTSQGDEHVAVESMKAGALDYVVKSPESLAELPRIVERTLREWHHIQQRRCAEEALYQSERKYRNLFENMGEAVAVDEIALDDSGNAVDWIVRDVNPAYENIFAIHRDQAIGSRASELYGPEFDKMSIMSVYNTMAQTGEPAKKEVFFPHVGKHVLISFFPMEDNLFATLSNDITERKKAEAERERIFAELDATINSIADAVIIYSPDGTIARLNPAAEELLGYTPDMLNRPLAERVRDLVVESADGRPFEFEETMRRVFQGEKIQGVLAVLRRSEGKTVWISISAAPIRTAEGKLIGGVGTASDITAMHDLQEQRDLYLHTISHDLRMPLTVIQGYAQI